MTGSGDMFELETDRKDDPLSYIKPKELQKAVHKIHEKKFDNNSVTLEELQIGARLAKLNFNNHVNSIKEATQKGETLRKGDFRNPGVFPQSQDAPTDGIEVVNSRPDYGKLIFSLKEIELLNDRQFKILKAQGSMAFWKGSKDLVITIVVCCIASLTQGWDQVANGNLGWPGALDLRVNPDGTGEDIWIFGIANAIPWFSAATFGCLLVDPICHGRLHLGRRGAVFIAAIFSFASMIGASQAKSWPGYIGARFCLGIGIGAKASIVPIWESEILPPGNRGRLIVLWQVFTATGIFLGSVATYIFRNNWRSQVATGAIPAFILMILVYLTCESPRWLVLQGQYTKAFGNLVKLRGDRILAAEELIFIHCQAHTERAAVFRQKPVYDQANARLHLSDRVSKIFRYPRNLRAALATAIVMLSQQLSGINILAFLASIFFNTADLRAQPSDPNDQAAVIETNKKNADDSLRLAIGFGVANAVFSLIAYFLIERGPPFSHPSSDPEAPTGTVKDKVKNYKPPKWALGRRSLLLLSLAGGTVMLFVLTFLLRLPRSNGAKLPSVMVFVILFTLFYSPGAGAVPFVYSSEVWPNEGREIGMSIAVFWNFLGAGVLAAFVPRGLQWGAPKLFGLFTGLSFLASILVFLYLPSPGYSMTLEAMSEKFDKPVLDYAKEKIENAFGLKFTAKSKPEPTTQDDRNSSGNDDEVQCEVQHEEMSGRKESGEEEAK